MRALILLVAAALLAGCQASPTLERLRGNDPAPEPLYLERRVDVGATHDARHPVEVGERAVELNLTLRLDARAPAVPTPAAPARLAVELVLPSGKTVPLGALDATRPTLSFATRELPERGEYAVHVWGGGVSEAVEGQGYGASYLLTLEVLHA